MSWGWTSRKENEPPRRGWPSRRARRCGAVAQAALERAAGIVAELHLVRPDRVEPQRVEVVDGGVQAHRLDDGHGARLELPGQVVAGEAVEADVADHLAATEERRAWRRAARSRPHSTPMPVGPSIL